MTEEEVSFQRPSSKYENLSSRFVLKDRNFQRQYAHLYAERLKIMLPVLTEAAKRKWGMLLFTRDVNIKCSDV